MYKQYYRKTLLMIVLFLFYCIPNQHIIKVAKWFLCRQISSILSGDINIFFKYGHLFTFLYYNTK